MENTVNLKQRVNWIFILVFVVIGVLNIILIHPIPGSIYLLLAGIYLPITDEYLQDNLGFTIPFALKVIFFLMVVWATLGVGDFFRVL